MSVTVRRSNPGGVDRYHRDLERVTGKEVAVGFPKGAAEAYPDGTQVATVAAFHVYGLGVPKRDFMALASDEISEKTDPIIRAASDLGDESGRDALYEAAGMAAQSAIRNAIVALDTPPNAPATIAAKGSDNPLVDTGHMTRSVTWVVRDRTR